MQMRTMPPLVPCHLCKALLRALERAVLLTACTSRSCLPPLHPFAPLYCRLWCGAGGVHPGRECRRCGSKTRAAYKKRTQVSAAVDRKAAGQGWKQAVLKGCRDRPGARSGEGRRSCDARGCAVTKSEDIVYGLARERTAVTKLQ